eukprot:5215060-Alexandrium_andersonii.AAC.1
MWVRCTRGCAKWHDAQLLRLHGRQCTLHARRTCVPTPAPLSRARACARALCRNTRHVRPRGVDTPPSPSHRGLTDLGRKDKLGGRAARQPHRGSRYSETGALGAGPERTRATRASSASLCNVGAQS